MSFKIGEDKSWVTGKVKQFLVASVATIGIFGLGTVLAFTSPALPDIERVNPFGNDTLTAEQKSWVGSIAMLGALTAAPVAGISVDILGRRNSMLIFAAPFVMGWLLISSASRFHTLLIGRFLTGFCGGAFSLAAPVYISETAESKIRGTLISLFQLMLVLGILFTYVVGTFVSWSNLALISAFVPGLALLLLPFIPATPRYLIRTGKLQQAGRSLYWLRNAECIGQVDIELEILEIEKSLEESYVEETKVKDMFKSQLIKPVAICLSLMILEQLSGFNAIIFYTGGIFKAAGTTIDSNLSSIVVGIVQVIATLVSSILVDRAGRRILLLVSQLVMALSLITLGTYFYLKDESDHDVSVYLKWLPLLSLLTFIVAFSIGIGPLSWTLMGEILPPNVKGVCSAIATSLVWVCGFFVTKSFDSIAKSLGISWCFWFFGICCIIGFISVYWTVPETKGKSLEEISAFFKKRTVKFQNPLSSK